jgi:hypothetical protein
VLPVGVSIGCHGGFLVSLLPQLAEEMKLVVRIPRHHQTFVNFKLPSPRNIIC